MFDSKRKKNLIIQTAYFIAWASISLYAAAPLPQGGPNIMPQSVQPINPTTKNTKPNNPSQNQEISLLQDTQENGPEEININTIYSQAEQAYNRLIQKQQAIDQAIQNYIKQKYAIDNNADECAKLMGQKEGRIKGLITSIESHNKERMQTFNTKLQEAQTANKLENIPLLNNILQELKAHIDAAHALQNSLNEIHKDFDAMQITRGNILITKNQIQQKALQHDTYNDQIQKLKSNITQSNLPQVPSILMQQMKTIEENAEKIFQEIITQSNLNNLNEVRGLIQAINAKLQTLDGQLKDLATKLDTIKTMIESYESNNEKKLIQTIKTTSQQLIAEETRKSTEKESLLKKLKNMVTFNKTVFGWIKEYTADVKKKLRAQE